MRLISSRRDKLAGIVASCMNLILCPVVTSRGLRTNSLRAKNYFILFGRFRIGAGGMNPSLS